jgi:hypothetical protein
MHARLLPSILVFVASSMGCSTGIVSGADLLDGIPDLGRVTAGGTGNAPMANTTAITTTDPSANGLPCDVTALLQHYCVGCHSSPPAGGAPEALLTYDDLLATAVTGPNQKVAVLALSYMQSGIMPPKPEMSPSAAELAGFQSWVTAGMPKATCAEAIDAGTIPNPYDTPLQCSSGVTWDRGDKGSNVMHPGVACIACHDTSSKAPHLSIGGTIYPTAHEPDDCNGASKDLSVLITEANGKTHTLSVNCAGNFFLDDAITTPFKAQVNSKTGGVRVMNHTQTSGDCNGCHTVNGSSNAPGAASPPGRIMAP